MTNLKEENLFTRRQKSKLRWLSLYVILFYIFPPFLYNEIKNHTFYYTLFFFALKLIIKKRMWTIWCKSEGSLEFNTWRLGGLAGIQLENINYLKVLR